MNDYISKPVALHELIAALNRQSDGKKSVELVPNNVMPLAV
jgi:DNA-binding response OmpR family regulator